MLQQQLLPLLLAAPTECTVPFGSLISASNTPLCLLFGACVSALFTRRPTPFVGRCVPPTPLLGRSRQLLGSGGSSTINESKARVNIT